MVRLIEQLEGRHVLEGCDSVGTQGIDEICRLLVDKGFRGLSRASEFCWDWKLAKTGTLPKRISKYVHQQAKIDLDDATLAAIGTIASRYISPAKELLCEFDRTFKWRAGDFGDAGSCFFPGVDTTAVVELRKINAVAARFYEPEWKSGIGRLLIMPWKDRLVCMNGTWRLDVGYGRSDHEVTTRLAVRVAAMLEQEYRSVTLSRADWNFPLYATNSRGIVIGGGNETAVTMPLE